MGERPAKEKEAGPLSVKYALIIKIELLTKHLIILFALTGLFASAAIQGQNQSNALVTYGIIGTGKIEIPSELVLKDTSCRLPGSKGNMVRLQGKKFLFVQKALNERDTSAIYSTARIVLETDFGISGDHAKITDPLKINDEQLKMLGEKQRVKLNKLYEGTGLKVTEWYGAESVKVNNQPAMKISYKRQYKNTGAVKVERFFFENNDRTHLLTLTIPDKESEHWNPLFEAVLNSFRIAQMTLK